MQQDGVVIFADAANGRFGLHMADGSHALGEQLDAQALSVGQTLVGRADMVGHETLDDANKAVAYNVFILAYGLSREALEQEFQG